MKTPDHMPFDALCDHLSRRTFLRRSGFSLGAIALGTLLGPAATAGSAPALPRRLTHFAPRAKRVIYLDMVGGPSQLDLFDPKPELNRRHGEVCPDEFLRGERFAFIRGKPTLLGSNYQFARHGRSGAEISELLPHLAGVADELTFIRSMHTDEFNHGPAQIFQHTGFGRLGRPSLGSWVSYGLGTENENLPAYVVLVSGALPGGGSAVWNAGFLPSVHQGVEFRGEGEPVLFLSNPPGQERSDRRRILDTIGELDQAHLEAAGNPEIATRIKQYELAFRMQTAVPELMDLGRETPETLTLYGAQPGKPSFANNCLLACRLVERGVRMVQLFDDGWDHHGDLGRQLPEKCRQTDRAVAALVRDLKRRGLLEDTLVVWGGEFGRTPVRQVEQGDRILTPGRDHHKGAYTMWLAGGGVKPGVTHGSTDEIGYRIARDPVHVHDLNATVLHCLGIDHTRLTYFHQGRDYRLTDVHGEVAKALLA